MGYFKILSLLFGALIILSCTAFYLFPNQYKDLIFRKVCPEKKPTWLTTVMVLTLLFIGVTWVKQMTNPRQYSWVLTGFLSLGLIKTYFFMTRYEQTRQWYGNFLNGNAIVVYLSLGLYEALGIVFVILGIVFF